MMIPPPSAGDAYGAAGALERQLRTPAAVDAGDTSSDSDAPDASPDVVVTLSRGPSSPATYDAAGRLAATPTLDDMGANGPDSLAHATESVGDDMPATDDSDADQDAAIPA